MTTKPVREVATEGHMLRARIEAEMRRQSEALSVRQPGGGSWREARAIMATGCLVPRTAPVLVKKRAARIERRRRATKRTVARIIERTTADYTVAGVNLLDELHRMLRANTFVGTLVRPHGRRPDLVVRRASRRPRTFGRAYYGRWRILIVDYPGITAHDVRETLCHELAHLATPGHGHGIAWKTMFRLAAEELLGVRPRVELRFHGEVTRLIKEREAAETAQVAVADQSPASAAGEHVGQSVLI